MEPEQALLLHEACFWACALAHLGGIVFGAVCWFLIGWPKRVVERLSSTL